MTVASDVLAEGKTKILRPGKPAAGTADTPYPELIVTFKDDATAFNGQKHAIIPGKGALNARISALLFECLHQQGIPTCFLRPGNQPNELVYQQLTMIPLEVVVRNVALGSMVKRFGFLEGRALPQPLVEFFYKSNDDPLITDDTILALNLVPDAGTLESLRRMALQVNEAFLALFNERDITCADFKLEFGFDAKGQLQVGDELSPDNFRLRDAKTGAVLDKDVFRLDLGDVADTYRQLLNRLEQAPTVSVPGKKQAYTAEIFVQSRKNILNPESKAILEGVHVLGYTDVQQLRAGKRFVLTIEASSLLEAERQARKLAEEVLSNPVIEDYELRIRP